MISLEMKLEMIYSSLLCVQLMAFNTDWEHPRATSTQ